MFALATLVPVVIVLAVLQYRWIGELSEAHDTQARSRLRERLRAVSDAFDTEVTRAALAFETFAMPGSSRFESLERAWQVWTTSAQWPRMVSGVALVESTDDVWRTRWVGEPAIADIRSILPRQPSLGTRRGRGTLVFRNHLSPELLVDGQPALLQSTSFVTEGRGVVTTSGILIRFDKRNLTETVFPRLLNAFVTPEDRQEFHFELHLGVAPAADALTAGVFHFRPDCVSPRRPSFATSFGVSRNRPGGAVSSVVVEPDPPGALPEVVSGPCERTFESVPALMQLSARPREEPMGAVLTRFRWRNEIVSALVLGTLMAAIGALVLSAERARKLARMQTVVSAGISHELRTPLASLRLAADDLMAGQVDTADQARRYGEIIDRQSRRLGHVVDQALALGNGTNHAGSLRIRPVSAAAIIDTAVAELSPTLARANMTVDRRTAANLPRMLADPELLARCLTNLIENAAKYASSGGRVLLTASASRRSGRPFVEIGVEDRGPGIDVDEAAAVFEPFYRGASARHARQTGSGLGLAIVKNAIEAHGGSIVLERASPQGCRFALFVPVDDRAPETKGSTECRPR
jgi:signal transduction histidine kinase